MLSEKGTPETGWDTHAEMLAGAEHPEAPPGMGDSSVETERMVSDATREIADAFGIEVDELLDTSRRGMVRVAARRTLERYLLEDTMLSLEQIAAASGQSTHVNLLWEAGRWRDLATREQPGRYRYAPTIPVVLEAVRSKLASTQRRQLVRQPGEVWRCTLVEL